MGDYTINFIGGSQLKTLQSEQQKIMSKIMKLLEQKNSIKIEIQNHINDFMTLVKLEKRLKEE